MAQFRCFDRGNGLKIFWHDICCVYFTQVLFDFLKLIYAVHNP
jgi:hypothetical protein